MPPTVRSPTRHGMRWRPDLASVKSLCVLLACGLLFGSGSAAAAAPHMDTDEAAALYETHCRSCHTEQVHWRDGKRVTSWETLVGEVDRWQRNLALGWSEQDVRIVAHYLNLRFYRFPPAADKVLASAGSRASSDPRSANLAFALQHRR